MEFYLTVWPKRSLSHIEYKISKHVDFIFWSIPSTTGTHHYYTINFLFLFLKFSKISNTLKNMMWKCAWWGLIVTTWFLFNFSTTITKRGRKKIIIIILTVTTTMSQHFWNTFLILLTINEKRKNSAILIKIVRK